MIKAGMQQFSFVSGSLPNAGKLSARPPGKNITARLLTQARYVPAGPGTAGIYPSMTSVTASRRKFSSSLVPVPRSSTAAPSPQQVRTLSTVLKPVESSAHPDVFFRNILAFHAAQHPELEGARFLGLHCTTALSMENIIENGFNPALSGKNWKTETGAPYSKDGKGVYTTTSVEHGIGYAVNAVASQNHADPAYEMRMIALYEKPNPDHIASDAKATADEEIIVTRFDKQAFGTASRETLIPTAALEGQKTIYLAVPLPAFGPLDLPDMESWLAAAGLEQAAAEDELSRPAP